MKHLWVEGASSGRPTHWSRQGDWALTLLPSPGCSGACHRRDGSEALDASQDVQAVHTAIMTAVWTRVAV
jgi:hypothetical protein